MHFYIEALDLNQAAFMKINRNKSLIIVCAQSYIDFGTIDFSFQNRLNLMLLNNASKYKKLMYIFQL